MAYFAATIHFPPIGDFLPTGEVRQPFIREYYKCSHIPGVAMATRDTKGMKRIVKQACQGREVACTDASPADLGD